MLNFWHKDHIFTERMSLQIQLFATLSPLAKRPEALSLSDIVCGEWGTSLREPTLHSWKLSDTSVSWMSISLGVGAAVGVPAALPHDGDPIVPPGEEVVKPSKTLRNFFIIIIFLYPPTCFPGLCRSVCEPKGRRPLCFLCVPRVRGLLSHARSQLVKATETEKMSLPAAG